MGAVSVSILKLSVMSRLKSIASFEMSFDVLAFRMSSCA